MPGPSPRPPIRATDRRSPDRGGLHAGIAVDALGELNRMRISIPPEERFAIVNPSLSSAISASPTPWPLLGRSARSPQPSSPTRSHSSAEADRGGDLDGTRKSPDTRKGSRPWQMRQAPASDAR
jgi:hypothetical protein